jgi:N-acetyl sugar amidotransferase
MDKLIYCKKCLVPATRPHLFFDKNGICAACINHENKKKINWNKRKIEFKNLVKKFKKNNNYDCIIPVSGGKDSTYQVIRCLEYNLRPLCVNATTDDLSSLGRENIENIKNLGVDFIEITANPVVRKKINKFSLKTIGDISWPEHILIFTVPIQVAIKYGISLIIWGENSQNEYGGPKNEANKNILDEKWLYEFGGASTLRVNDLVGVDNIIETDLLIYKYPDIKLMKKFKITGIFLGHYFEWDGLKNKDIAEKNGFKTWNKIVEGSFVNYENLDNYHTGIHDYFCYLKYGFGRATMQASLQIRRKIISRKQALKKVKELEGKYPISYLGKKLDDILKSISMTEEDFINTCDQFTNKKIFKLNNDRSLYKDNTLSLKKINYDN